MYVSSNIVGDVHFSRSTADKSATSSADDELVPAGASPAAAEAETVERAWVEGGRWPVGVHGGVGTLKAKRLKPMAGA